VDLLRAFGALRSQCPQARLLLIGEGPLRSDIESQVLQSGLSDCVRLLGMRQDLTSMLPALDLGVLASSSEGLSNAVLELLSCGVPAVVTSVGGNPDLVTHDHNGMLVAPQCPESMSAALLRALGDGVWRFQAGQQARQTVLAQWSVAAMVQGYERLYQAVLSERSLGRGGAQQPDQR
jgi:glycosyltransferase involved in cell wall biosynthesis